MGIGWMLTASLALITSVSWDSIAEPSKIGERMLMEKEWGVTVEKPIEDVFDAYVDQLTQIWDLGPVETLTEGPFGEGTRLRQSGEPLWGIHDPSTVIDIVRFEPHRRLTWSGKADVPGSLGTGEGFSTLYNMFISFGWGSEATADAHFLPLDESKTKVVIFGRNRVSRWGAVVNPFTRWFGYWWVNRRLTQFKDKAEGLERVRIAI